MILISSESDTDRQKVILISQESDTDRAKSDSDMILIGKSDRQKVILIGKKQTCFYRFAKRGRGGGSPRNKRNNTSLVF